jgi:hypothetical protein
MASRDGFAGKENIPPRIIACRELKPLVDLRAVVHGGTLRRHRGAPLLGLQCTNGGQRLAENVTPLEQDKLQARQQFCPANGFFDLFDLRRKYLQPVNAVRRRALGENPIDLPGWVVGICGVFKPPPAAAVEIFQRLPSTPVLDKYWHNRLLPLRPDVQIAYPRLAGSERSVISAATLPRQPPMLVEQGKFFVETDLLHIRRLAHALILA